LKFTALNWGRALEIYKDTLRTFEIFAHRPLARRGRRAGVVLAKIRRGKRRGLEEKGSASTRGSRRTFWRSWERERMIGGGVPTVAEAAAEGRSSARGFPVRRRAKLGLDSCSRTRGSYWSSRIGWRRGGGKSSTVDRSLPAKGRTAAR
jgi:hypothetical protein